MTDPTANTQSDGVTDRGRPPDILEVKLDALERALGHARLAVFDFETDDVRPRVARPVGLGVYLPVPHRSFYINVGHLVSDPALPKYCIEELAAVVGPFLADPSRHAVAHNATYEIRMFFRMGVDDIRCRWSCSLIHTHRIDECLRSYGQEPTYHPHVQPLGYGLKEMTTVLCGVQPPTLHDVIGKRNTASAPPLDVARYCALDIFNSYNLFARVQRLLDRDPPLRRVVERIDDPNNVVLARMLWEGIEIDADEARRQCDAYEIAIQKCREAIWAALDVRWPLDSPKEVRRVLRLIRQPEDSWPDEEWEESVAHDAMVEQFEACHDLEGRQVIALLIAKSRMQQRCNVFLRPMAERIRYSEGRLHADRFDSTLATTRFSSKPNLQNLPGRADAVDPDDEWIRLLPPGCGERHNTRNVFVARRGHVLVALDLSAAEPRYLAMIFQKALEQKHGPFLVKRDELHQERVARYGRLISKMRASRSAFEEQPRSLQWPDLEEDPLWRVFAREEPVGDPYDALLMALDPDGYSHAERDGRAGAWLKENRWRGKRLGFPTFGGHQVNGVDS